MKKWLKYTIGIAIVVVIAGILLFDVVLEKALKTKLSSLLQQDKERLYDYRFDHIEIGFLSGDIVISGLKLIPRSHIIDSLAGRGDIRKQIFSASLEEFRLGGLKSWKFLLSDEVVIRHIILDRASFVIYRNANAPIASGKEVAKDILVPTLEFASIDSFKIINSNFSIWNVGEDSARAFSLDSAEFYIYNLSTDSAMLAGKEIIDFGNVYLSIRQISVESMKDYSFSIKRFYNNPLTREIFVEGFDLRPRLDRYEFMKTQPYETDWFSISLDRIVLRQGNRDLLKKQNVLSFASVSIEGLDVELYRDKRLPDAPEKLKKLPSSAIRRIGFPMYLPEIDISSSRIRYMEWEDKGAEPLRVWLENLEAAVANFSTWKERLSLDDTLRLSLKADFMGESPLTMKAEMPILDSSDVFFLDGILKKLPFEKLNPLLEHSAFVKFEEGKINYMKFSMRADDSASFGDLDLSYAGLKGVKVMHNQEEMMELKEEKRQKKEGKKMFSLLANTLIPNEYGPESESYYPGRISSVRNKNKSVFNYLVKSIQTGIMTSMLPQLRDDYGKVRREKKQREEAEKKKEGRKNKGKGKKGG